MQYQKLLSHGTHKECVIGLIEEKLLPRQDPIVGNDEYPQTHNVYGKGMVDLSISTW